MCFNHDCAVPTILHVPIGEDDLVQGLDLSESEDEGLEDIVEDFVSQTNIKTVRSFRLSDLRLVEVSALGRRHAGGKAISFPISCPVSYLFFQDGKRLRSNT